MASFQRVRQGLRALFAFSQPLDLSPTVTYLTPELQALFKRMQRSEQLHSLNVLRHVLAQGPTPPDLAVAALLHDVGKTRYPLAVWQKTGVVLVRALLPELYQLWSRGDPAGFWQRPFVVYAHHPRWSADLMAEAGASDLAVWLAAHHADSLQQWADHPYAYLLQRLQQADDAN